MDVNKFAGSDKQLITNEPPLYPDRLLRGMASSYNLVMNQPGATSTESVMRREDFFEVMHCLARSRRRQFRIGDLMVVVVMTAVGLTAISGPDLAGGERLFLAVVAVGFLGLLWAQWGVASIPTTRARSGINVLLGVVSSLMALSMFVCLILLGLVFPQGVAVLSVLMLFQVVYMTTWE
jgi:hypothetical protein